MADTEIKLSNTIAEFYSMAGVEQDRMDCDITLMKMSHEQHEDLAAMIDYLYEHRGDTPVRVLAEIVHDLNGLKAGFLGLPGGVCFSPRSSGFFSKPCKR